MSEKIKSRRREQVIKLREAGLTYAEIGRKLSLTRERIRQIISGQSTAKKKPARHNPDALLSTAETAEVLNVHVNTVRRWSNKKILVTHRIGPRRDRRFRQQDIDDFLLGNSASAT